MQDYRDGHQPVTSVYTQIDQNQRCKKDTSTKKNVKKMGIYTLEKS
jgi:hypothetical protein